MRYPPTWLYVATGQDGVRKVGSTINPENRMKALRLEYWQPFKLNRTWHRPAADGRLIEQIAHAILRPYRAQLDRRCVELYQASLPTLYAGIERAIVKAAAGDLSDLWNKSAFVKAARRRTRKPVVRQPWIWRTAEEWQEMFRQALEEMNRAEQ